MAEGSHWIGRAHHRVRSLAFAFAGGVLGVFALDANESAVFVVALLVSFCVYPQLAYVHLRLARDARRAEQINLHVDQLLNGIWSAALGFPIEFSFMLGLASGVNVALYQGARGVGLSLLAWCLGAGVIFASGLGFHPIEETTASRLVCLAGAGIYLLVVALVAHLRIQQARRYRRELIRNQAELREAHEHLEARHRTQREFLALLSAEFLSPLAAIARTAEALLERGNISEQPSLRSMRDRADGLHALVERFLPGEVEAFQPDTLRRERCNVRALLTQAIQPLDAEHRIRLHTEPAGALAHVDRQLMAMALGNLVGLALRHSEPGSLVMVDGVRTDIGVSFDVISSGSGFSAGAAARLGTPFYLEPGSDDIGRGFLFVQRIIDAHGGNLRVDSDPEIGTRFSVVLPEAR